jgi:excinuclease UvrABC nuclease subunit
VVFTEIQLPTSGTALYFLMEEEHIVYIGVSKNLFLRIGQHNKYKNFTSFMYIECEHTKALKLERKFIKELKPYYNIEYNK